MTGNPETMSACCLPALILEGDDSRFRARPTAASPLAKDLIHFVPDFFTAFRLEISHCAFHVRVP